MHKSFLLLILGLVGFSIQSQTISKDFRSKLIEVKKDTIQLDSVAINSQRFKIFNVAKKRISDSEFKIDFSKATLIINAKKYKTITVEYFRFPEFITKTYSPFDENLIIKSTTNNGTLYSLTTKKKLQKLNLLKVYKLKVLSQEV